MFRFTIRDMLWMMVVVAFGVCWLKDHNSVRRLSPQVTDLQKEFKQSKKQVVQLQDLQDKQVREMLARFRAERERTGNWPKGLADRMTLDADWARERKRFEDEYSERDEFGVLQAY
jgi:hypothetical protein